MRFVFATVILSLGGLALLPIGARADGWLGDLLFGSAFKQDTVLEYLHPERMTVEEREFFKDAPPPGEENAIYKNLYIDRPGKDYIVRSKTETDPTTGDEKTTYFDPKTRERRESIFRNHGGSTQKSLEKR